METKIAVAGGTGLVGAMVVEEVRRTGATPVVIARSQGIDLTTGGGLAQALDGVDAVVDASNVDTMSARRSVAFFEAATGHLLAAGAAAGVRHHVALSIVGCDRVDLPYYLGKRRQEELVAAGPVPWSVLRATQFHEFAAQLAARSPRPFALAPRMRTRPVAAREVAAALVRAARGEPAGRLPDLGGPRAEDMGRMVRDLVRARGIRRIVVPVPMAGRAGRQVAAGGLLPGEGATLGSVTFDDWLARG
ncbi:SDR family oxidoreductase [Nocardioides daeguensis]|uniref:NAD(P)H-binding protein n=1 Tax=Nocardioides daeguensis TaxID=908359 RepID=A0ABP6UVG1_9ACTN|nr:NAD(P)H-binding protein [Nocardioides daeguensis]MBV6725934.1 NAD(P)H-binding protein [Nocardioides daeguensis]MCR1772551.1 NAD(P)H-binding protein [Nocardioides daeguensis]